MQEVRTVRVLLWALGLGGVLAAGCAADSAVGRDSGDGSVGADRVTAGDRAVLVDAGGDADAANPAADVAQMADAANDGDAAADLGSDRADAGEGPTGPICPDPVLLFVDRADGYLSRLHLPATYLGMPVSLFVDTGSALTYLYTPPASGPFVPNAGEVTVGCGTWSVPGRPEGDPTPSMGLPTVGTLGADYVLGGTSEIDFPAGTLVRHPTGTLVPGTDGWAQLPFDNVLGQIIGSPISVDGQALRLMVDTGSDHIVWLGEPGRPGDVPQQTMDAAGNVLTFFYGLSRVQVAGEAEVMIPVLRIPSWPYFEQTVRALGGNIQGLAGLSALGDRRVIVDPVAGVLRLQPAP